MANKDEVRISSSDLDADGLPLARTRLTHGADQRDKVVLAAPQAVIPIVFLPGIMGTNLKSKETGNVVWRPPNTDGFFSILDAIGQLIAFAFRGAATRQRRLHPDKVDVDESGPLDAEGVIDESLASERGWGALMRSAYNPVMAELQKQLNDIMTGGKPAPWWSDEGKRSPADYGEEVGGNAALDDEALKHAAGYRYEVWGGGYNWLQSNRASAQDIIDRIEDVILPYYRERSMRADKVILVTHSMGGLVGRSVACLHDYKNILGVIHGVMPATGAAATYHHCRAGYEGVSSVILGRDAGEVVAILAQSPGGLELLPAADYKEGQPWLKLGDKPDSGNQLPSTGDPYREIYLSTAWYGLVPEANTPLLDPAGLHGTVVEESELDEPPLGGTRKLFDRSIEEVMAFHQDIQDRYHHATYSHFGDDDRQQSWSDLAWEGAFIGPYDQMQALEDNHNGSIKLKGEQGAVKLKIADPADSGDGTVPASSGAAPKKAGARASFRQGNQGQGAFVGKEGKGYEHQGSYNDERSLWASLYGVVLCADEADWA